jgi:hypothetical protein
MADNLDDGIGDDDILHLTDPGSPLVFKVICTTTKSSLKQNDLNRLMQIPANEDQVLLSGRPSDSNRPNTARSGAVKLVRKLESFAPLATLSSSPIVSARIAFRIKRSVRFETA